MRRQSRSLRATSDCEQALTHRSLCRARASPAYMIRLIDVHKAFGPKRVLEGFTLDVVEGETMVIIGYSGTGKSVAIKHIVGLLEPDSGQVIVDGLEVPKLLSAASCTSCARASATSSSSPRCSTRSPSARTSRWGCGSRSELDRARDRASACTRRWSSSTCPTSPIAIPGRAVGRNAQARRHRARDRAAPEVHPVRRADDGPRSRDQRRHRRAHGPHARRSSASRASSSRTTCGARTRVGTRIAMLYEGRVRQVGTVDEIQHTTDPVVRQFIEGRADARRAPRAPPDVSRVTRARATRPRPAASCYRARRTAQPLFLLIRDSYQNWGFPKGHVEDGERAGGGRAARSQRGDRARRVSRCAARSNDRLVFPLPRPARFTRSATSI